LNAMNPIAWIKNGRMPNLWVLARVQLGLGVVSLLAGVLLGVAAALYAWANFKLVDATAFVFSQLIGAFTFSTAGAVFILGSAVTAYCASRDDRERSGLWQQGDPRPSPPTGREPSPPPFRAPATMLDADRKAFEDDIRPK
jgi:hypothetical protein